MRKIAALSTTLVALMASPVFAQSAKFGPAPIEKTTDIKPAYNGKENVYTVTKPRQDAASVDGWKIPSSLRTSSYA